MDCWWRYPEIALHVSFCRRTSVDLRVVVDEGEVLALLGRIGGLQGALCSGFAKCQLPACLAHSDVLSPNSLSSRRIRLMHARSAGTARLPPFCRSHRWASRRSRQDPEADDGENCSIAQRQLCGTRSQRVLSAKSGRSLLFQFDDRSTLYVCLPVKFASLPPSA